MIDEPVRGFLHDRFVLAEIRRYITGFINDSAHGIRQRIGKFCDIAVFAVPVSQGRICAYHIGEFSGSAEMIAFSGNMPFCKQIINFLLACD